MSQILSLPPPARSYKTQIPRHQRSSARGKLAAPTSATHSWTSLSHSVKCNRRISCLFSDNRRQEDARKSLESALGGKKMEFEKWDKEIKRREEAGGGGNSGGGGWLRWFGGSDGDHFWQEAQQAGLAILGILVVYLIVAKGDMMLAVVLNPLLFALRGTRTSFTFLISKIKNHIYGTGENWGAAAPKEEAVPAHASAKERVVGKWGSR